MRVSFDRCAERALLRSATTVPLYLRSNESSSGQERRARRGFEATYLRLIVRWTSAADSVRGRFGYELEKGSKARRFDVSSRIFELKYERVYIIYICFYRIIYLFLYIFPPDSFIILKLFWNTLEILTSFFSLLLKDS